MQIPFNLTPEDHDCLLHHTPDGSTAYVALKNKVDLTGNASIGTPPEVVIECGEKDAQVLLGIAKKYCPNAAWPIEKAILNSQPIHS